METSKLKIANIDFMMMKMTKDFLDGKLDGLTYRFDFEYHLAKRYKKMHKEDSEYCDLIYENLFEDGVLKFDEFTEEKFKKVIKKHYTYIKQIAKEGFF